MGVASRRCYRSGSSPTGRRHLHRKPRVLYIRLRTGETTFRLSGRRAQPPSPAISRHLPPSPAISRHLPQSPVTPRTFSSAISAPSAVRTRAPSEANACSRTSHSWCLAWAPGALQGGRRERDGRAYACLHAPPASATRSDDARHRRPLALLGRGAAGLHVWQNKHGRRPCGSARIMGPISCRWLARAAR